MFPQPTLDESKALQVLQRPNVTTLKTSSSPSPWAGSCHPRRTLTPGRHHEHHRGRRLHHQYIPVELRLDISPTSTRNDEVKSSSASATRRCPASPPSRGNRCPTFHSGAEETPSCPESTPCVSGGYLGTGQQDQDRACNPRAPPAQCKYLFGNTPSSRNADELPLVKPQIMPSGDSYGQEQMEASRKPGRSALRNPRVADPGDPASAIRHQQ